MVIDETPQKKRGSGKGSKKNWKRIVLRTFAGLAILFVVVGAYLGVKGYVRARQVFKGGGDTAAWNCNPSLSALKQEGDGRINFLVLGKGGPTQPDGPDLTDTIIVASIDPCNKEAGLLSIPRDLVVKMDSGESTKINAVYALTKMSAKARGQSDEDAEKAGISAIEKSVQNVVGIKMNFYTMVDFTAFEQAVDAVGGVDINVPPDSAVYELMSIQGKKYNLSVSPGQQHFDGLRALAFTRSRETSLRGDFARSERQREVIVALSQKVFSLGTFSNPVKISQLLDTFGTRVRTDISSSQLSKLYDLGKQIDASNIKSVSLVDEPNVLIVSGNSDLGLGSIQVPKEGLFKYDDIRNFVRTTFVDSFIKKENPGIVVLNGTSVGGLATTKADVLKGYGYNVVNVGDAPNKDVPTTVLVDLGKKDNKYTRRYLELRYDTTATTKLPDGIVPPDNADFVIILGQNETNN